MAKSKYKFEPEKYIEEINAISSDLLPFLNQDDEKFKKTFEKIIRKHPKDSSELFRKDQIVSGLKYLANKMSNNTKKKQFLELANKVKMKPMRTESGVTTVTVLTKPFDCPGECVFCPNDVRMPKSYIATEPGAQRALQNRFSPYLQTWNRLQALKNIGHPTSKIELLVLGGTWSSYPQKYQIWFISECFRAMNDWGIKNSSSVQIQNTQAPSSMVNLSPKSKVPPLEGRLGGVRSLTLQNNFYNKRLKSYARENRKKQTPAEMLLWSKLRNKQMFSLRFLRQRPIDKYIVDFLQPDYKLIIEIDGMSHDENKYDYDQKRELELKSLGFHFIRFTEFDVKTRMHEILESIHHYFVTHPNPPSREEGDSLIEKVSSSLMSSGGENGRVERLEANQRYQTDDAGFLFEGKKIQIDEYLKSDWNNELRKEVGDLPYNKLIKTEEFQKKFSEYLCNEDSALPPKKAWEELGKLHELNASSQCKCVGLVLETRPDSINEREALRLRKLGATKIQLGIQTLNDEVSALNKRGEGRAETSRAFRLLRLAGFKIHAHMMPNLYRSTPQIDRETYRDLFELKSYKPDEVKIYPTSLIKNTELYQYFLDGKYKPYSTEELVDLVADLIEITPEYSRLTRIIRDIPSTEIEAGNKTTNLREVVEHKLKKEGRVDKNIRAREIRNEKVTEDDLKLDIQQYETEDTNELFLQYITNTRKIAGFLRLSLPKNPNQNKITEELNECAMIREIHVYGPSLKFKDDSKGEAQHLGLGTKLIEEAKTIAKNEGFKKLAVISAIGTREYYAKRGFKLDKYYQIANL